MHNSKTFREKSSKSSTKNQIGLGILMLIGNLVPALSQAATELQAISQADTSSTPHEQGPWSVLASAGAGYSTVVGRDFKTSPAGPQGVFGVQLSFEQRFWEMDAGLGWTYNRISGDTQDNLPVEIRTRAGIAEMGARYRLWQRVQFGPVMNVIFGTDTGFGPSIGQARGSILLGPKLVFEISRGKFPIRAWAQASSDLNIGERKLLLALAGLQVGFNFDKSSAVATDTPTPVVMRAPSTEAPVNQLTVVLDPKKVFFATDSAALRADVILTLHEVGSLLSSTANPVALVEISGHADQRGKAKYNLDLSKKRAESVERALVRGGADPTALRVEAYGFQKPLDSSKSTAALAKNRRVELKFENVRDPEILKEKLRSLEVESPQIEEN